MKFYDFYDFYDFLHISLNKTLILNFAFKIYSFKQYLLFLKKNKNQFFPNIFITQ